MSSNFHTRREFCARLASFISAVGIAGTAFGATGSRDAAGSAGGEEVSHTAESIHQEVVFKASRKRVYEALTGNEFSKVKGVCFAPLNFSCVGSYIVGQYVELVQNKRIVEAWRAVEWDEGVYSIARFELKEQGSETKIVFDHTGFPKGQGEHLAARWKTNYWEPLQKYLGSLG